MTKLPKKLTQEQKARIYRSTETKDLGITKQERKTIERWGYSFPGEAANGIRIDHAIYVVHNPSNKHDSGYPYIIFFGVKDKKLYGMGWHDHFVIHQPVNTDALGKNIFRICGWYCKDRRKWRTKKYDNIPFWNSTLELTEDGLWW